jgi:RNA polymerase sigma-70 factor (ECF subfamily)
VDDESAVAAFASTRDPEAFRVLVDRYQRRVLSLVASVLGPYADMDAQEVAQEVFLRLHEKLQTFRGEARFGSWLYRLAYNRALEHRRRARIRMPHLPLEELGGTASADPQDLAAEQERSQLVARLVERLPDIYRTVIYMHYWLECSVDEMAETLGVPPGTVKSYLSRARQRLRDRAAALGIEA